MPQTLRWLHISDFHAGLDRSAQELQLSHLMDHINATVNEGFLPDKIFITGDVAQGGKKDEYALFQRDFLTKIKGSLPNTEVVLAPGNHDLVLPNHPEQHNRVFLADESKCHFFDSSVEARKNRDFLAVQFRAFSDLPGCQWLLGDEGFRHIPGDSVDILCFNSAWIAWGSDSSFTEKGNLPVGAITIGKAFSKVPSDRNVIALGHHPIEWMSLESRDALVRELRKHGGLYLCGHEHQARLDTYGSFENEAYQLRAGSSFSGRLPAGSDWTNSLIWGELTDAGANRELRIRPRRWSSADGYVHWASNFPRDPKEGGWYEFPLKVPGSVQGAATPLRSSGSLLSAPNSLDQNFSESRIAKLPQSLDAYLHLLESEFEFTFQKTSRPQGDGNYVVFWPVRARQPTLVHAMQAFSAAGLTRLGATILLVIDDLAGQSKLPTRDLEGAISRWFSRVGAKTQALHVFRLSDLQPEINQGRQWIDLITKWFALQTEYKLRDILSVSKLDLTEITDKKARKLLTPTLIWSAFSVLMEKHQDSRFVTLGGVDERKLWEAWRSCIDDTSVANHVYNPEVKDDQGQRFDLDEIGWSSLTEIRDTLSKCLNSHKLELKVPPTYWLPFVAYQSCVVLPAMISEEKCDTWESLVMQNPNPSDLARRLADRINTWYLPRTE